MLILFFFFDSLHLLCALSFNYSQRCWFVYNNQGLSLKPGIGVRRCGSGWGECISVLPKQQMLFNGGRVLEWFLGRQEQSLLHITAALPYQPCSWICRLFAREDSKHVVQIVGLRELQVDSVELLLEVTLPSLLCHYIRQNTRKKIILLSASKMDSDLGMTSIPLHIYKRWVLLWENSFFISCCLSAMVVGGIWENLVRERILLG